MYVVDGAAFRPEEADEICQALAVAAPEDVTREEVRLANAYHVKPATIRELVNKIAPSIKTPPPAQAPASRPDANGNQGKKYATYTCTQKAEVLRRTAAGEKVAAVAKDMGIAYPTAYNWVKAERNTRPHIQATDEDEPVQAQDASQTLRNTIEYAREKVATLMDILALPPAERTAFDDFFTRCAGILDGLEAFSVNGGKLW